MTIDYAGTESEARKRHTQYASASADPFPDIHPALLNSADIADYVRVTAMLFPFSLDKEKLKTASYEIDFVGDVYFWEKDSGQPRKEIIGDGGLPELILPRNSIYFFSPRTLFQIPDYIALRFNLRIKHVHRGLLLGTGPLVDPGFQGRLLIPLHNLTSTDYKLEGGKGLIWVEFTKLSPKPTEAQARGDAGREPRIGPIVAFLPKNKNLDPAEYLVKAAPHDAIRSSVLDLEHSVKESEDTLKTFKRIGWAAAIVSILVVVIAIFGVVIPAVSTVQEANKYVKEAERPLADSTDSRLKTIDARVGKLEATDNREAASDSLKSLETRVGQLEEVEKSRRQTLQKVPAAGKADAKKQ